MRIELLQEDVCLRLWYCAEDMALEKEWPKDEVTCSLGAELHSWTFNALV
jgi:hypothetical protein